MLRRDFLRRLTLTTAGLLVADDALALIVEPRRRFWTGANFGPHWRVAVNNLRYADTQAFYVNGERVRDFFVDTDVCPEWGRFEPVLEHGRVYEFPNGITFHSERIQSFHSAARRHPPNASRGSGTLRRRLG